MSKPMPREIKLVSELFGPNGTMFTFITDFLLFFSIDYNGFMHKQFLKVIQLQQHPPSWFQSVGTWFTQRGMARVTHSTSLRRWAEECSSKAKMQHDMPRNSEEEVGKASRKSQGTRDAFQWLLRLGDRWWSPHFAAPPCPLTGGRTTLLQQDALSPSWPLALLPKKWLGEESSKA